MIDMQPYTATQRRLAEVEALARSLTAVQSDLAAYRTLLCQKLDLLRTQPGIEIAGAADPGLIPVVQRILAQTPKPVPASLAERRNSRRRFGNPISIYISDETGTAEPIPGWVTNRSSTGLGLWTDEEEPVGMVLSVRPVKLIEPDDDWWAHVVVRHCRSERGRFVVGCQFLEQVSWKQLKLFG